MYICICIYKYLYLYVYIYIHMYMYIHVYMYMYICIHIHTHIHIHIHIHIWPRVKTVCLVAGPWRPLRDKVCNKDGFLRPGWRDKVHRIVIINECIHVYVY